MCGIHCYCNAAEYSVPDGLKQASETIKHRGPDDYEEPRETIKDVYMSFHRLRINGLNSSSNQPLTLGSCTLICNGEIYNHHELGKQFNFKFSTQSDCEVILHLFSRFGIQGTVERLHGVYAFVLTDSTTGKLYAGRDTIGVRPMFWGNKRNGSLVFCSEAKGCWPLADADTIQQFPPSSYLVGAQQPSGRWEYSIEEFEEKFDLTDYLTGDMHADIRNLVTTSVKDRCLMSDRKVGVFLSGGLDSTLVARIAKDHLPEVHSFAIGLEGSPDLKFAAMAAAEIGTVHHEIVTSHEEIQLALKKLIWHLETPDITTIRASLPMYLLSKHIKNKTDITVMLSGEGPDEVFSGYMYNHLAPSCEALHENAVWRTKQLHLYDVLRSDRATAAWSLEVRVPFLDTKLVRYVLGLDPKLRDPKHNKNIEKYLLRKSFQGAISDQLLWRPKEAFSDGVGYSMVDGLKQLAKKSCFGAQIADYKHMQPQTQEAALYREIYNTFYGRITAPLVKEFWMPCWTDEHSGDPSATKLSIHKDLIAIKNEKQASKLDE